MTINKFQGKTKEEAIENAKKEFGEGAVIMNVREVKPKGILKGLKASVFEVTAAMEEKEEYTPVKPAVSTPVHKDSINLAADEEISIPKINRTVSVQEPVMKEKIMEEKQIEKNQVEKNLEERLDNLSNILEEKLGVSKPAEEPGVSFDSINKGQSRAELKVGRILYNTLLNNEVNEIYVNQLLDEIEKFLRPGNSVDVILSNIYQKLILKFGQPKTISFSGSKPKVVFFIGPTGVGKTTTIAKIASKYKVEFDKKVAFITADTYRIAAIEQLKVYANILDAPMSIVYSPDELNETLEGLSEYDLVLVDTAGFSHKNQEQRNDVKKLIDGLKEEYTKEVFLTVSATTKYKDLMEIVDIYKTISDFKLIFTKLDETTTLGNILNLKLYSDADLSYVTNGQNVPDDIEVFNTQKIVKQLLGGK